MDESSASTGARAGRGNVTPPRLPRLAGRSACAARLVEHADALARRVVDAYERRRPEDMARWGERGRRYCLEDTGFHVRYLAAAIEFESPPTFTGYVRWVVDVLAARGIGPEHVRLNLRLIREAIEAGAVPGVDAAEAAHAATVLRAGEAAVPTA